MTPEQLKKAISLKEQIDRYQGIIEYLEGPKAAPNNDESHSIWYNGKCLFNEKSHIQFISANCIFDVEVMIINDLKQTLQNYETQFNNL